VWVHAGATVLTGSIALRFGSGSGPSEGGAAASLFPRGQSIVRHIQEEACASRLDPIKIE